METVADVMTSRVHVARPQTPFKRLVQLIEENKISAIPIVDDRGFPVGIVSESDLLLKERRQELESEPSLLHPLRRREQRAQAKGVVASEIMTAPPITVRSDTALQAAARLMQERNVRRLVVVDERDKIAGIVSRSDLLRVFLRTYEVRETAAANWSKDSPPLTRKRVQRYLSAMVCLKPYTVVVAL